MAMRVFYCEVINELITRMIIAFGDDLLWATPTDCKDQQNDFTDQPEFTASDILILKRDFDLIEITKTEFEDLWAKAQE